MREEDIEAFCQEINENCQLLEEDFEEKILIDVPMPMSYVTEQFVEELSILEPFGAANEKPVFAQKNVYFLKGYRMGKKQNMARFDVKDEENNRFTIVCFRGFEKMLAYMEKKFGRNMTERLFDRGVNHQDAVMLDIIYYPSLNEFRGKTSVQYILQDYR